MIWNESIECMERDNLHKIQSIRLKKIVEYVYHNTPFYRKKMQELGIIKGSNLTINPQKVGFDVTAFIGIYLDKGSQYSDAVGQLEAVKEVVELHYCTGQYSMFAKLICSIHLF